MLYSDELIDIDDSLLAQQNDALIDDNNLQERESKKAYEPQAAIDSTQIAPASNIYRWFVLHTYSGYETMVKDNLEMVFKKNNLENRLSTITIPVEDVIEEKPNGRKKIVKRRIFPCYVFIKMDYDNSLWHMITKTRGVTGFVGPQGRPLYLTDEEIKKMKLEAVQIVETNINIGDNVRVVDGTFEGNIGQVETIDTIKNKVKIKVDAFGRQLSVELDLVQVELLLV